MQVCDLRNLCSSRIDDKNPAVRIFLDFVDQIARVAESMGELRIATKDNEQITVFDIFRRVYILCTEQVPVDPKITSLFLRKGTVIVVRAHRPHQRHAVGTTEVVSLSAATVKGEGVATVRCADVL
jgi:hypothetical protein